MASYCHFWRLSPGEYWALDGDELAALSRFMQRHNEAQRQANKGR